MNNRTMKSPLDKVAASPIQTVMAWKDELPDDIINLCQAAPDYPPAPELQAYLKRCVQIEDTYFYTPGLGIPEVRAFAAQDISTAYATRVLPDDVALTAGCNEAFCAVTAALCHPGDEVILPLPYYFNHAMWLDAIGARSVYAPFVEGESDDDFVARLDALITNKTRAIVVVTPDNPTGRTRSPESLTALFEIAARRNITLILDETYRVFRDTAAPPHNLFKRPDWQNHFIHLYSYSKTFSLTGMRVGLFAAAPDILQASAKWLDCVTICPPVPGQLAVAFGIRELDDWVAERRAEKLALQKQFAEMMRPAPGGFEQVSAGAFFAWLRHPFAAKSDATEVARRLAYEHGVLCLPGSAFGPDCDRYLRLSVANATSEQLDAVIAALTAAAP